MKYNSVIILSLILFIFACGKEEEKIEESSFGHKVKVNEVIQANNYTYAKVEENSDQYWIAVTKREVEVGETLYYVEGMEMKDFESNDLNRTFDRIIFVQNITNRPMGEMTQGHAQMQQGQRPSLVKEEIAVKPADGGVTISQLYSDLDSFKDKTVRIRGKVTVFNPEIMSRNWIHIQDGTEAGGNFDLTVTSNEKVNVGDELTFEGKIALDADFGYGYTYRVLLIDAKVVE